MKNVSNPLRCTYILQQQGFLGINIYFLPLKAVCFGVQRNLFSVFFIRFWNIHMLSAYINYTMILFLNVCLCTVYSQDNMC